ncbi:MAG: hypothetical protein D6770_04265 [Anaerolineae bacterium]|nr:MAG: hypothetical protein D6770_04265 [Anaerolineae bacterium]
MTSPTIVHDWLRLLRISYLPGEETSPLLERCARELLARLEAYGHTIVDPPQGEIDVLLTTAPFGKALNWRHALMFTARRRLNLPRAPLVITLLHATPERFRSLLDYFEGVLKKDPPDPADYDFPGLAAPAYRTLFEQGRRGGPILALMRLLQAQAKCIRLILVIGHEHPIEAYTFDLVGAHPRTDASDLDHFYTDLALRIATAASTSEINHHETIGDPIPWEIWQSLDAPKAMKVAGRELGKRNFFTEMVRVDHLAAVPAVPETIARQYSEGCFATWEPRLNALIATITGSARPVVKDDLTDDELAVIVGVRPDGKGALVRHVEGKRNDPPSSEAVELIDMDARLPRITLDASRWGHNGSVPVTRSKLHGHRGVRSYDPQRVEFVPVDPPYQHYPVSCSTDAQARAICAAFQRSEALTHPEDPRQIVFTVLPGHGIVIVEKWVAGKAPFQAIWEAMDDGSLEISPLVPQGPHTYRPNAEGKMQLYEEGT